MIGELPPQLAWLYSTQMFGIKLGLDNVTRLLRQQLAMPAAGIRVLHVAGTNGKGSVCAIADALVRASGHKCGLFTSPHLVDFRERIRVDGEMIPPDHMESGLHHIRHQIEKWDPHPTFFEITLTLAMQHFRETRCEVIILETGMGGRLDATNAVPADVVAITPIGFDHSQWLGDTIAAIATEKAGIIRHLKPVLSAPQLPEARQVIEETANIRRAPIRFIDTPLKGYSIALPGQHQKLNAALAIEAVHSLGIPLRIEGVRSALANVHWPGRFEIQHNGQRILDAAHNGHGMQILVNTWIETMHDQRPTIIFGAVADKDIQGMLAILKPIAKRFLLTPPNSPRAADTNTLQIAAKQAGIPDHLCIPANSLADALISARQWPEPTLITGSIYLVGEAHSLNKGGFQTSGQ